MGTLMLSDPTILAFLAASFVLAATPGPGVLYIVTRTVTQGRLAGLASVGGVALGNFGNAVGASLGLAAIFAVSSVAFAVVKWLGAGYLIYIGLSSLRAPGAPEEKSPVPGNGIAQLFRDGLWVALLNPKTAIFFAAFLPQFLHSAAPTFFQSVVLGTCFVVIAACTDTAYVLAAAKMAPLLRHLGKGAVLGRYLTAGIFIGLGVFTALTGNRSSK